MKLLAGCCPKTSLPPPHRTGWCLRGVTLRKIKASEVFCALCCVTRWDSQSHMNRSWSVCVYICVLIRQIWGPCICCFWWQQGYWHSQLRRLCSTVVNWPCRNPKALELVQLSEHKAFVLHFGCLKKCICPESSLRLKPQVQCVVIFGERPLFFRGRRAVFLYDCVSWKQN